MQHYSVVNKSSNSSSLYYMSTVPNSKCILLSLCNQPFSRSTVTESFLWLSTGISYLYFLSYHLVINLNLINTLQLLKIFFFLATMCMKNIVRTDWKDFIANHWEETSAEFVMGRDQWRWWRFLMALVVCVRNILYSFSDRKNIAWCSCLWN